jgi:hypothetical protein
MELAHMRQFKIRTGSSTTYDQTSLVSGEPARLAPPTISRRRFLQASAGMLSAGLLWEAEPRRTPTALAASLAEPMPIPGSSPAIQALTGQAFHVFGPTPDGSFDPVDAEPATITDFNGFVGLAYVNGMVTRTNQVTGEQRELPFTASDMRFMSGNYRGVDGRIHQGTFAFI